VTSLLRVFIHTVKYWHTEREQRVTRLRSQLFYVYVVNVELISLRYSVRIQAHSNLTTCDTLIIITFLIQPLGCHTLINDSQRCS